MYDNYGFVLDWEELPEELREEKIRAYILHCEKRDCEQCDGVGEVVDEMEKGDIKSTHKCFYCDGTGQVDPNPDSLHLQEEAEDYIRRHFPIYF